MALSNTKRSSFSPAAAAWSEEMEYPVVLGTSFSAGEKKAAVTTFRYEFFPKLIDTAKSAFCTLEENGVQVEREQVGGSAKFHGQLAEAGPTEYALIFDGSRFILEKVESNVQNLRLLRNESSKRKRTDRLLAPSVYDEKKCKSSLTSSQEDRTAPQPAIVSEQSFSTETTASELR